MISIESIKSLFWNRKEGRIRALWRIFLGTILFFLGFLFAGFSLNLISLLLNLSTDISNQVLSAVFFSLISFFVLYSVLGIIAKYIDKRKLSDYGLKIDIYWWKNCLFGLILGAILQTLIFLFGLLFGWFNITGLFAGSRNFIINILSLSILFLMVGIIEEILTRGWLLTNIAEGFRFAGKNFGVLLAVFLSSVIFSILHLLNPGASLTSFFVIFTAGIFLSIGYILTGQLAIPIGVHISWNFFQGPVFNLGVSGFNFPVSVFEVKNVGPVIFTGGKFGPEAGIMGMGAVILGSILTILWVIYIDDRIKIDQSISVPDLI